MKISVVGIVSPGLPAFKRQQQRAPAAQIFLLRLCPSPDSAARIHRICQVQNKDPVLPFALQQIRAFPATFHSKRKRVHIYTVHTDSSHNNGMGNFFAFTDLLNIVRQINRSMFHLAAGKFQFYFLPICYVIPLLQDFHGILENIHVILTHRRLLVK